MHSSRPGKKTCKVLFSAPPPKPLPPRSTGALRTAMPPRHYSSSRQSTPRTSETATQRRQIKHHRRNGERQRQQKYLSPLGTFFRCLGNHTCLDFRTCCLLG